MSRFARAKTGAVVLVSSGLAALLAGCTNCGNCAVGSYTVTSEQSYITKSGEVQTVYTSPTYSVPSLITTAPLVHEPIRSGDHVLECTQEVITKTGEVLRTQVYADAGCHAREQLTSSVQLTAPAATTSLVTLPANGNVIRTSDLNTFLQLVQSAPAQ